MQGLFCELGIAYRCRGTQLLCSIYQLDAPASVGKAKLAEQALHSQLLQHPVVRTHKRHVA